NLWHQTWFRRLRSSWPFLLLYWYVLKPAVVCALLALWWRAPFQSWSYALGIFAVLSLLLNSRFGYALSEACLEAAVLLYGWLRFDFLQGLYRFLVYFFKGLSDTVEYVLYTVDEWLRFRTGESRVSLLSRAILSVFWFPVGYVIWLYFVTLVEPS